MSSSRPVHEIKFGCVKAVIWRRRGSKYGGFNTEFYRFYKDGEEWKQSKVFHEQHLPLHRMASEAAFAWIVQHGRDAESPNE